MLVKEKATVEDLYREEGKAEIVNGEIVRMSPAGAVPGRAASKIFLSLARYEEEIEGGLAFGDNVGFIVNLENRRSFSPDAAWFVGPLPDGLEFVDGPPTFAVEVRSSDGYGPRAERAIMDKIRDYFAAGTLVVWDVDLREPRTIRKYVRSDPDRPQLFVIGEMADAEPAVPGWRFSVSILEGARR